MPDWFPDNLAEVALFAPLRIAFLILVAIIVRQMVCRLINRSVLRAIGHPPRLKFRAAQALVDATSLPAERREQRIGALGSLGRSAVTAVITIVAALTVLTELGFNITTIVAGTSVVAVTIAFGVQSIVKDLISGIFLLVEDQLGVGDFVDMEKASGVVESIGLRVTQLRDDYGTVWYVRNGEVVRVGNFSQGGPGRPPGTEAPPAVTPPATPAP
ncbi:MAG TPA: mechanosensitive ion channel domain-containing protein [Propionibacteriaceae bacterium]|nr:mechanosensitive ion channel domain-containing protein [Propionibacteriaceae bacterium]